MKRLVAGLFLAAAAFAQEPAPLPEEALPKAVAPQPVAFSHRVHATALLACDFCHAGAAKGDAATLPPVDLCLTCHRAIRADSPEVAKLRDASERGSRIAWVVPVYRVPDYVFFGHAPHLRAGHACAECHGPVETRDVLQKEVSTSMNGCLDCHRRRDAPRDCVACHQLGH